MKNAMIKAGYRPRPKDYVIKVNPFVSAIFPRGLDPIIRDAVAEDLAAIHEELEDEGVYQLESGDVEYLVEKTGDLLYVDSADWLHDMHEIQVT